MTRKVLFYTHAFGGGGAEIVFRRLADAFAEAGDDVIFAADYPGPTQTVDRGSLRHELIGDRHWAATCRLAALLRREKPDASFSALGAQNIKHLAAALLAGRHGRCILGYHGFAEAEPKTLSRLSFQGAAILTRLAARTVCVSDALRDSLCRRWHASRSKTLRIYNPVPAPHIERPSREADAPPLILACGRLIPGKRFADLVAALVDVAPTTSRLAIVGEGPERGAIEAACTLHGVSDRVDMPGHVEDMSSWYACATCLAIASESESFGLTAAEALAHGVPVVTTDCGGPVEILAGGRYGRIVSIGDVGALAAAITQTLAAPGDAAPRRERATAFAIEAIHRSYADLIDALP